MPGTASHSSHKPNGILVFPRGCHLPSAREQTQISFDTKSTGCFLLLQRQKAPEHLEYHRSKQLSIYSCLILEARLTQDFLCLTWQSPPAFTSLSLRILACFTSDAYPCNADYREDTLLFLFSWKNIFLLYSSMQSK